MSERGGEKLVHTLTQRHPAVKHLYCCERCHRWQWVPEKRLSELWQSLDKDERARVVQTHEGPRLTRRFSEELDDQMRFVECNASEEAKKILSTMIWCDRSGLSLFKGIFTVAVELNYPMVIDMDVIAVMDTEIQDFCASVSKGRRMGRKLPGSFLSMFMGFAMFASVFGGSWLWFFAAWAIVGVFYCGILRDQSQVDPRSFPVGSDLWVQYREREHVRLAWMGATVRVFELRLLRLLERRRRAEKLAALDEMGRRRAEKLAALAEKGRDETKVWDRREVIPRKIDECTDGAPRQIEAPRKKTLGPRRLLRQRRGTEKETLSPSESTGIQDDVPDGHGEAPPPRGESSGSTAAAAREDAEAIDSNEEECPDYLDSDGDEIDAEFARRRLFSQADVIHRIGASGSASTCGTELRPPARGSTPRPSAGTSSSRRFARG